jgi:hypothetical protein
MISGNVPSAMIGFILTLLTAILASGLAAIIADDAHGEPVRIRSRDRGESDESGAPEQPDDSS